MLIYTILTLIVQFQMFHHFGSAPVYIVQELHLHAMSSSRHEGSDSEK